MFEAYRFPRDFLPFWHLAARMGIAPVGRFLDRVRDQGCTRIIDIASGAGATALQAARRDLHVIAMDLAPAGLRATRSIATRMNLSDRIDYAVSDCRALPYLDASVEVLFASHVIEHLEDPQALIQEAARVLKPGGRLWLSCPSDRHGMRILKWFGIDADPEDHQVEGYSPEAIASLLEPAFTIERIHHQCRFLQRNLMDLQQLAARAAGIGANPSASDDDAPVRSNKLAAAWWIKELPLVTMIAVSTLEDHLLPFLPGSMISIESRRT